MSRQLLEEFMVAYRHNQCLWKIKSKDYLNKDLKFEAYKQLVQICRKEHRTAGREFVVKKINSLRGSFRREYKRVISEENYVPQLWFYDLMQFTADQETSDEMNSAAAAALLAGGCAAGGAGLLNCSSGSGLGVLTGAGGGGVVGGSGGIGAGGSFGYEYNAYGDDCLRVSARTERPRLFGITLTNRKTSNFFLYDRTNSNPKTRTTPTRTSPIRYCRPTIRAPTITCTAWRTRPSNRS